MENTMSIFEKIVTHITNQSPEPTYDDIIQIVDSYLPLHPKILKTDENQWLIKINESTYDALNINQLPDNYIDIRYNTYDVDDYTSTELLNIIKQYYTGITTLPQFTQSPRYEPWQQLVAEMLIEQDY